MRYPWAMRPSCLALPLLALLLAAAPPAPAQPQTPTRVAYVAGMEDVPLMAGLAPTRANDVTFDSPRR
jgi:hypothetical protein